MPAPGSQTVDAAGHPRESDRELVRGAGGEGAGGRTVERLWSAPVGHRCFDKRPFVETEDVVRLDRIPVGPQNPRMGRAVPARPLKRTQPMGPVAVQPWGRPSGSAPATLTSYPRRAHCRAWGASEVYISTRRSSRSHRTMVSCSAFVYPMTSSTVRGTASAVNWPSSATLARDGRAADQRRIAMFCFRTIEGGIGTGKCCKQTTGPADR